MIGTRKQYEERRERGKGTKGMKEMKKKDGRLRYKRNHSPFNLSGLYSSMNYNAEFLIKNTIMTEVLKVRILKQWP
jgi:hypothetical protein